MQEQGKKVAYLSILFNTGVIFSWFKLPVFLIERALKKVLLYVWAALLCFSKGTTMVYSPSNAGTCLLLQKDFALFWL